MYFVEKAPLHASQKGTEIFVPIVYLDEATGVIGCDDDAPEGPRTVSVALQ